MNKIRLTLLLLAFSMAAHCQDSLWFTRTGHIYFISHTDIIDIDANHNQVGSFLNTQTGELVVNLLMKSFRFTLPLAEEHFNENYVESEKFPKSTFKGKVLNYSPSTMVRDKDISVTVQGDLTIHGVTSPVTAQGVIRWSGNEIVASSRFTILLETYKIKVPNLVADRVAKEIPIDVKFRYEPYKKSGGK